MLHSDLGYHVEMHIQSNICYYIEKVDNSFTCDDDTTINIGNYVGFKSRCAGLLDALSTFSS